MASVEVGAARLFYRHGEKLDGVLHVTGVSAAGMSDGSAGALGGEGRTSQANGNMANNTRSYGIDALPQQPQTLHCCRIPRLLAESALVHAQNVSNRNPRNRLPCATHMRIMSAK
jgi:hypothetical protein